MQDVYPFSTLYFRAKGICAPVTTYGWGQTMAYTLMAVRMMSL